MSYNPQNPNGQASSANSSPVVIASDQSAVPVSATALPLPTGAATAAKQDTGNTSLGSIDTKLQTAKTADYDTGAGTDTVQMMGVALPKSGGAVAGGTSTDPIRTDPTGTTAQPVSASSLPLPAGAATAAKQPALGTAGTPSADVITVQGATSMTAIKVDGSATTQPVSGTVAVGINAGTNAIGTVSLAPTTTGGWSVSSQTALTSTATVSGAAGKFGGYMFTNTNTGVAYIQVFDTTGAVTLGTTTPTFVVPVPAGSGANLEVTNGIAMASGIKVAATTTATGSTTVSTAITGFVLYK